MSDLRLVTEQRRYWDDHDERMFAQPDPNEWNRDAAEILARPAWLRDDDDPPPIAA